MRSLHILQIIYLMDPDLQVTRLHDPEEIASIMLELLAGDDVVH